ncbi:MAG: preprotein translocase subunit YajC [Verrucomicrobiota bacterium]
MMIHSLLAMGGQTGDTQQDPKAQMIQMIAMFAILGGMFYFLMIRPQSKQRKEQANLLNNLRTGDKVLMSNGIFGIIANVKEKSFVVKIADNVKIEVVKSAVTTVVEKGNDTAVTTN